MERPFLMRSADALARNDAAMIDVRVLRAQVDARLEALLPAPETIPQPLHRAMRYGVLSPGKRLRPLLAMLCAAQLGADPDDAIDVGCALELVHASSLILDDLPSMDDAKRRRGVATTHIAFGEDVAMLASISLLARAFSVISEMSAASADARMRCVSLLSAAIGPKGLSGGQFDDLRGGELGADAVAGVNLRKTGTLFTAAVEMAAALCRADAAQQDHLVAFAEEVGFAFQICDDLIDIMEIKQSPGTLGLSDLGKDVGQDLGKSTIVGIMGATGAKGMVVNHLRSAQRLLAGIGRAAHGPEPLGLFMQEMFGRDLLGAVSEGAAS